MRTYAEAVRGGYESPTIPHIRTAATLQGPLGLRLVVRRYINPECELYRKPCRPEQEGAFALPQGEPGLDVIALVGALCHAEHHSVPEVHRELSRRGIVISERTVTKLLDRYEELVGLLAEVRTALWPVTIAGVISDGQRSIYNAVREALPGVAHQLCQFHYLREAAKEVYAADRHAKKELKKRLRGLGPSNGSWKDARSPEQPLPVATAWRLA